jgi:hypothetical protein
MLCPNFLLENLYIGSCLACLFQRKSQAIMIVGLLLLFLSKNCYEAYYSRKFRVISIKLGIPLGIILKEIFLELCPFLTWDF